MLSETETHYLVGFLYLHTQRTDVTVETSAILGAKVRDEAAEKTRDVDIVVAIAGETALIGVEVKDEARPLDVITVEQVCVKLKDMPTLRERFLVSTSGFTAPARKKARAHGLGCLRLVHGSVPEIGTVDMSDLKHITYSKTCCLSDPRPNVHLEPDATDLDGLRNDIQDETSVSFSDGSRGTVRDFCNALVTQAVKAVTVPVGDHPFRTGIVVEGAPRIELPSRPLVVTRAIVTGIARREIRQVPNEATCFLEDENGQPFAAAIVSVLDGALFGLMLNDSRRMGVFLLPEALRTIRPVRHEVH